jgi:hypothetical protein
MRSPKFLILAFAKLYETLAEFYSGARFFNVEDLRDTRWPYTGRTESFENRGTTGCGGVLGSGTLTSTRVPDPVFRSVTCPSYSAARCLMPITPMP